MSKKLLGFGVAVSVLSVMLNFGEAEAQMSCVKNDLSEINFVHSDSLGTWKIHDDTSTILSGTGAVDNGKEAFHFIVELGLDNTCRLGPNGGDFSFHFSEKSENTTFESEKCQSIEPEKTRVKKTDHGWLLEENGRILTTGKGNGTSAKRLLRAVSKLGFNRICQDNLDPPLVVYFKTARDVTAIDFGPDVQFKNGKFKLAGKSRKEMINNALNWVEKVLSKGADRARLLIRFKKPVTPSDRGALVKRGLIPIFAMDPKTWFVSVTDNGFKKALFTDEIVWAGPVSSNFKISQELVGREPFEYEERDKGLVAYRVQFMPDVTAEEVRSLARRINANLEDFNDQTFPITRFATVALRHDRLQLLGDQDAVAWIESVGPYPIPDNAQTILPETKANVAHATPYNMDGAGIAVGVWEAFSFQAPPVFNTAAVLTTHLELAGRATPGDTVQDVMPSNHATHVAGTIASSGANLPVTKGVAPAAVITSWDAQNDCTEMTMAALAAPIGGMIIPIQVSNHSYGQQVGWANGVFGSQAPFGIYNNSASCFDSVATGTGLVIVKSAGNDRDDPAPGLATAAQPADCFTSFAPLAGDCITPGSTAKNVITVGAMDGGDQIAAFSNFGPTDDGRIKPDVVAPGDQSVGMQSIVSLGNAGVRATARFQGTSMAAPAVSGVAALAIQNARALAIPVQSASIKSLLVHTANDVKGTGQATPGPDFATGWGMVDAVAALSYLRRSSLGIPSSTPSATTALAAGIQSGTLLQTGNAGAVTFQFMVRNTAELKVTLGWDDPQPMMLAPPILVNDLDLTLTDPTGQSFEPWMLDPSRPGLAAVQNGGQDQINNIVQVSVPNPSCGVWTATVSSPSGATNLMNGPMMAPSQQNFALMLPTFPRSSFQIDFDGNGRSDIFRANGSEWRFSADGVQGWQHLNVSGIDSQLKFGHFDCDGLTDVFHSHGGKFNVSFGGRTGWTAINNSGVTSGLRLGDFDGDGIADVFRADGSQWWVSLGGSTGWTPLAQSSFESHELRFGDFDGDGITDVFRGDGEDWKVSFGGVGAWTTINVSQFETDEVAFGDFDGDGITDVFRADGEHWWISFSGTGSWQRMAQSETSLPDLEFADFDGDGTTDVFRGNGERWFFSRSAIGPWTGLARSQLEARDVSTR